MFPCCTQRPRRPANTPGADWCASGGGKRVHELIGKEFVNSLAKSSWTHWQRVHGLIARARAWGRALQGGGAARCAGFSLVEVTLASTILVFLAVFTLDSVIAYRRLSDGNKGRLLADAYAWDVLWKQFNRPFDHLETATSAENLLITLPAEEARQFLPELSRNGTLPIRRYLRIRREGNLCTLTVNVYWQVSGKWYSLWQAAPDDPDGARSPYRLVRTNNSRLTE